MVGNRIDLLCPHTMPPTSTHPPTNSGATEMMDKTMGVPLHTAAVVEVSLVNCSPLPRRLRAAYGRRNTVREQFALRVDRSHFEELHEIYWCSDRAAPALQRPLHLSDRAPRFAQAAAPLYYSRTRTPGHTPTPRQPTCQPRLQHVPARPAHVPFHLSGFGSSLHSNGQQQLMC
jgi:hypothetical protein